MYYNKAIIVGNLTRDPEMRSLPSGTPVTTFGVATNRTYRDSDGNRKEQTDFHNIVVFGRQAETSNQYLRKGNLVMIEGRIQNRSWEADDGSKRYRSEIVADRVQFGPKGVSNNSGSAKGQDSTEDENQDAGKGSDIEYPNDDINPDDIPF